MKITFEIQADHVIQALGDRAPKQLPFAVAHLLTHLAKDGAQAVTDQLPHSFDRPTPFTLKAVSFKPSNKTDQESAVYFKESQEQAGRAKNEHVRPGLLGAAARQQKKTEYLLTRMGDLPAGWVTVPGPKMPKDGYGNLPGAIYKQIVNVLQLKVATQRGARPIYKASQKRAAKLGVVNEFFTVAPGKNTPAHIGQWLRPGVYRHLPGRKLLLVLKFIRRAKYSQLMDTRETVAKAVTENIAARWKEAADQTIKSAIKVT